MKRIAGFKKFDMWDDHGADDYIKEVLSKDKHAEIMVYVRSNGLQRAMVNRKKFKFDDYLFDFDTLDFRWKNTELQLTKQEQTALYAWLAHEDDTFWKDCLRRMRDKFGKDFMRENYFGSTVQD